MSKTASTKIVTGKVRFSYLNVFEARAALPGQEAKFSVSLIIPKNDIKTLQKINAAIEAAKDQGISSTWGGRVPANLKLPLRDGDAERADDDAYKNAYFLNANSVQQPGVVDANLNAILDPRELYSGCYGRASVNFYPYDVSGNRGVACGLNNLQKLTDGDFLGGRSRAEEDFADEYEDDLLG